MSKIIKCLVAGLSYEGPDIYFVKVRCSEEQYINGDHYETAKKQAEENGYEGPFVAFDENDPPRPIFDLFAWDTASIIDCATLP